MGETIIAVNVSTFVIFMLGAINLVVLGPIAWILRSAISDIKRIELEHDQFKDNVQTKYVRIERYVDDVKRLEQLVRGLYDKLDQKADKP